MAEDDIRLKDALIGIVAIVAMDVLLVVTVFVMLKAGLATRGLGTIMPVALAVYALCLFPVATAASWGFMVDRSTIRGATPDPENSIESHWYSQASENTLHAMLFGIGGLGIVSSFWEFQVSGTLLTIILGVFVTGTFGISYFAHKRATS